MTTFISYSRVNAEFVVRLARDLRAAGYDVWLDQLDIPKGARWDDEIEAAVERSSTFMIVLAPESIESQNVKDELSYAIDSGKHILPVVIRPCKIPLRLRRFQYVDFTDKPYRESLADIKRLLSNTHRIVKASSEETAFQAGEPSSPVTGPLLSREVMSPADPLPQDEPAASNRLQHLMVPVSTLILVLALVGGAIAFALNRNNASPPSATVTSFTSTQLPPTITFTSTAIPLPVEAPDEHNVTMRLVNSGDFTMGSESGVADEQNVKILFLDVFYIDKYEVTNSQYRACVQKGACLPPKKINSATRPDYYNNPESNSYPVVYVDWNMARSYCEWRDARLPTEAEWEKAARGPEGNLYPWGEDISCDQANYASCQKDTVSVSTFKDAVSPYGVYNMAGNVYEWVSSLYIPYPYDLFDGREDLEAPGERVIRGGSWIGAEGEEEVRSARRQKADPTITRNDLGFRCVRTPDESFLDFARIDTPLNASTATAVVATSRSHKTREAMTATAIKISPSPTRLTPKATTVTPNVATTQPPTTVVPSHTPQLPSDTPQSPSDTPKPPSDTPEPPTDTPCSGSYC